MSRSPLCFGNAKNRSEKNIYNVKLKRVMSLMKKRDYYDILGVSKKADKADLKKAYRTLAKKYHPDTNAGDEKAAERFKEITEAYNVLSDDEKRKLYDQFGHAAFSQDGAAENDFGQTHAYHQYHHNFDGQDMNDIFGDMFGSFFNANSSFDGFENFYRDHFANREFSENGRNLHAEVEITFDEAAFGCKKVIHIQNPNSQVQSLEVSIPAGIESGKIMRLKGKGMPVAGNGQPGDLLLKVNVKEKPGFERKGTDIYSVVSIPFTTAVLGGEATVPTIYGNVICKIKEGTQSGSKIRLKGKGIISLKNPSLRGDQYTTIQIQVPQNLTREAKKKLMEFAFTAGYRGHGTNAQSK